MCEPCTLLLCRQTPVPIPGVGPPLSGSRGAPLERQLRGAGGDRGLGFEEAVERSAMRQVEAHQASEGERAGDGALPGLGQPQQQKGNQRDGDLDAHSILAGAEKTADLEGLLDPAEEQLDRPAALVEIGVSWAGASRSLDGMRMTLPLSSLRRTSRTRS